MDSLALASLYIFPALLIMAGAYDLTTFKIPNWLNGLLALTFIPLAFAIGMEPATIASHVGTGLLMLVVGIALFSFGWIGGGDAKLIAAVSLWCGWTTLVQFLFIASIAGGLLTIALLMFRGQPLPDSWMRNPVIAKLHNAESGIPYGVALAAGGLLIYQELVLFAPLAKALLG